MHGKLHGRLVSLGSCCVMGTGRVGEDEPMGEVDALEVDLAAEPGMGSGPNTCRWGSVEVWFWQVWGRPACMQPLSLLGRGACT